MTNVVGRAVRLTRDRVVFVGFNKDEEDGRMYMGFINSDGDENRFQLNADAAEALRQLLNGDLGLPIETFPTRQIKWGVVDEG